MVEPDGLIEASRALLALMRIDEPTPEQHAGALFVAGALSKLTRF